MPLIQHIVLLKFQPQTPAEKIVDIFRHLQEITKLIPGITYFTGGTYSSNEGLNQGYTHGFLMTFESAAARDAYLPDPIHEKVKVEILSCIDDVIAFDLEG
ncbi:Dabb family protein [Nostoc sp.]|uniref:Dabb family protein n=1 Tax=Nostoc sp. TaxID=1180 RepID=UPI002FF5E494